MKTKSFFSLAGAALLLGISLSLFSCKDHNGLTSQDGFVIGTGGLRYKYGDCIFNPKTGKRLLTDIEWIYETGDSICVVAKDGKRGYLNLNTCKWVVPLEYYKGWVFSCDRGCMSREDTLFVFDRKGSLIATYPYHEEYERLFYKNHLVVSDWHSEAKVGLVDTAGRWSLPAEYESIEYESPQDGFFNVRKNDYCMLLDMNLDTVLQGSFDKLDVDWSEGIIATEHDGTQHLYNYHGEMLYERIFRNIEPAYYDTGRKDANGEAILAETDCFIYSNYEGKKGLMDRHYHCITPPEFYDLEAREKHLFFASFGEYNSEFGTLIDDSGHGVLCGTCFYEHKKSASVK